MTQIFSFFYFFVLLCSSPSFLLPFSCLQIYMQSFKLRFFSSFVVTVSSTSLKVHFEIKNKTFKVVSNFSYFMPVLHQCRHCLLTSLRLCKQARVCVLGLKCSFLYILHSHKFLVFTLNTRQKLRVRVYGSR